MIIQLYRNYGGITVEGTDIRAGAGALLSQIASAAKNASLTGFEFAGGIPGTLGGAVVMNAGAYGGEMKDVLKEVTVMTEQGEIMTNSGRKTGDGISDQPGKESRISGSGSSDLPESRRRGRNQSYHERPD